MKVDSVTSNTPSEGVKVEVPQTGQLGLIGFESSDINRVFGGKVLKNAKGEQVGESFQLKPRKDIAKELNLTGKENKAALEDAMLKQSDEAFRIVKGQIAALGVDWTLAKVAQRTSAAGVRQITVTVKEITRKKGATDEQIAEALGWTVEQVREARTRQEKALSQQNVDEVQS